MPDVFSLNRVPPTSNNSFYSIWALTRALKKAGYQYRCSSNGTTKDVYATPENANPDNDLWNGTGGTVSGQTGSSANITVKTLDDLTITGLTGMTPSSVGRYLAVSGAASSANNGTWQIVAYVSSTSVKIRNKNGVGSDANTITWTEKDPMLEVYPTALETTFGFWGCQGVTTVKLPISVLPTGTFLRGEKITQTGTNAEGELLGVAFNTASDSYLTILPRVGTFNNSTGNAITGAISGATVVPSGAAVGNFIEEILFAKDSASYGNYSGWLFCQRPNTVTENAQRFSVLANSAGCTATVAPGCGGTGNVFPTIGYTIRGDATGSTSSYSQNWESYASGTNGGSAYYGRQNVVVTNIIGNPGVSPDGTFWVMFCVTGYGAYGHNNGIAHMRCDDTEEGDVDPFVWVTVVGGNQTTRTYARPSNSYGPWSSENTNSWTYDWAIMGWRRRGFTNETWTARFIPAYLSGMNASYAVMKQNSQDPDRVASHPATPFVREPMWCVDYQVGERSRKGTLRWLSWVPTGGLLDTWEGRKWIQISASTSNYVPCMILGPWDGSTAPEYS